MIIWNGWGFVVAVITFGCLLVSEASTEAAFADDRYYQQHGWPKMAGFLAAALLVWIFNQWMSSREKRVLINAETGQPVTVHPSDALFFIPLRYWAPILVGLAIIFSFVKE